MIPVRRSAAPPQLTLEAKKELIKKFLSEKKDVWNQAFIRDGLMQMSHGKCVYCEARLDEKSMYMEVEHFLPKSRYPLLVVEWDNLLASCKHCNASKSDHDPCIYPIVNPSKNAPNLHLSMHNYFFTGIDDLGILTIEVLDLNDLRNVQPRFVIGNAVMQLIEEVRVALKTFQKENSVSSRNRALRSVRRILKECAPDSEYSVTVATIVSQSQTFSVSKAIMQKIELWSDEFEQQYRQALGIACAKSAVTRSI